MAKKKRKTPARIEDLKADPTNPREIDEGAAAGLATSLETFGDLSGITFNVTTGELVSGHQRVAKLRERHGDTLEIQYKGDAAFIETAAGNRYNVRLVEWSKEKQRAANVAANNTAIQGEFTDALDLRLVEIEDWDADLYAGLLLGELATADPEPDLDASDQADESDGKAADLSELKRKWKTVAGQVWKITGQVEHRIVCGDCTHAETVAVALEGIDIEEQPITVITDPPYCSGGNQEAGKSAGSVGRRGKHRVSRDQLSTRGFNALIRSMLERLSVASVVFIFCDWRMWVYLFDLVESQGYSVKNMVVWDKESPGMGSGIRSQHELVMPAAKVTKPFDASKAIGNVRGYPRTGNFWHDTEKPVDLIFDLVQVTAAAAVVVDPFGGSGSTLIACDRAHTPSRVIELEPHVMAAALERAQLAGMDVELVGKAKRTRKKTTKRKAAKK